MGDVITVRQVRNTIRDHQFHHADEFELHDGVQQVLAGLGLATRREVTLDNGSRIDLTAELPRPAGIPVVLGIEVKIAGKPSDVRRQVQRYAGFAQLDALLLVTTIYRHMAEIMPLAQDATAGDPAGARYQLGGKPFDLALINRGLL